MRMLSVLDAVTRNGDTIKYVDNPSLELQLAAVRENGFALQHIDNPSLEVLLAAIDTSGGNVLMYIKNRSEEVELEALKNMYEVTVFSEKYIKVGCTVKSKEEWLNISNDELQDLDLKTAVDFYPYLKEFLTNYKG